MSNTVSIPAISGENSFDAYIARPTGKPKAAILVIQEVLGVNAGIRRKCDKWAEAGYLAIAPDLFWRIERGIELDADIPEELDKAIGLLDKYDPDDGIEDIKAAIDWIRNVESAGNDIKIGCVGYCLGGRLAYMAAARTDMDASIGYYGVMIDQMLDEAGAIDRPLMLHIPTADHFVGPESQKAMHDALDSHPMVTLHDYVGLDHAFATEYGERRDDAGAVLADQRTTDFFKEFLG